MHISPSITPLKLHLHVGKPTIGSTCRTAVPCNQSQHQMVVTCGCVCICSVTYVPNCIVPLLGISYPIHGQLCYSEPINNIPDKPEGRFNHVGFSWKNEGGGWRSWECSWVIVTVSLSVVVWNLAWLFSCVCQCVCTYKGILQWSVS